MHNKYKGLIALVAPSAAVVTFFVLRFAKLSPIIGSSWGFFSLSDVVMPLTGTLGLGFGVCAVLARLSYKVLFLRASLTTILYYLPGFCAAGSWAKKGPLFRLLLPIVCMILFVVHPVGFMAAPYCLYWLIPIALYFLNNKSIFLQSLSSTFVAHAVGSVIWLYSFDMSSQMWLGLIPVVAVERLFFASAMTLVYITGRACKRIAVSRVLSYS
ncbi:MAG: hypothetical protein ACJAZS_000204 [Alteromonas naphthalenivorans]|jgi:hypothetical protein